MPRTQTAGWIAAALIAIAAPAQGQFVQQGGKLVGSSGVGAAAEGTSVAVSADGNTAAVGGPGDSGGAGAVWVYTRAGGASGGAWTEQARLVGSNATGAAGQGRSVALSADGNTLAVGGPNDNTGTGATWIYTRSNGVWTQQGPKKVGGLKNVAHQGISVALSADGNTALVGAELDPDGTFVGAAWVFTRSPDGTWGLFPDKLIGANFSGGSHQGFSVALSNDGNTALVGGPGDNGGAGAAWTFVRTLGAWAQQAKLVGSGASGPANQGYSVALSADGNTAFVGGDTDSNNAGAVWAFTRANNQWTQQGGKLTGSDAAVGRYLGASAALSADGNTALAGGPGALNTLGRSPAVGATWVFVRSGAQWSQQSELVGSGTATNDALQGTGVAVSGDATVAFIGGPAENGSVGAAWVFTKPAPPTPPTITTQPANQTVARGQTATLSVTANGPGPLTYQWYLGGKGVVSSPVGTNSNTYTTPPLTASATYWVRVSNPFGSVDSNNAVVGILVNPPVISQVSNAASGNPTIAPNTWIQIQGTNLSSNTRIWQSPDFVGGQMPSQLDGVSATVNGKTAYIYYISPTQLNILSPPDALPGPVLVQVSNGGVLSAAVVAQAQSSSPSFFVIGSGPYAAAEHANGSYLGPPSLGVGVTPAKPGETVVLYGNGFGAVTTPIVTGSAVQSGILAAPPAIQIGGVTATVQFAGLVAPGEFQFNVVVPFGVPDGDNPVTALYNGVTTQTGVLLTVAR